MKRALTLLLTLLLTLALVSSHATLSAQRAAPQSAAPRSNRQTVLVRGQQITVEFADGHQLSGIAADVSEMGIWRQALS